MRLRPGILVARLRSPAPLPNLIWHGSGGAYWLRGAVRSNPNPFREALMSMDWNARNNGIIAELRANGGKVGGNFEGAPMVIVHTKVRRVARSG